MDVPGRAHVVERPRRRRREVDAPVVGDRERERGERDLPRVRAVPVLRGREGDDVVDLSLRPGVHVVAEQHGVAADDAVGDLLHGIPLDDAPDHLPVDHRLGHRARRHGVVALQADVREVDHLVLARIVLPDARHGVGAVHVALVVGEDRAADVPVVHLAEVARVLGRDVVHVEVAVLREPVEAHVLRVHHHAEQAEVAADPAEHLDLVGLRAVAVPERALVAGGVDAFGAGVLVERAEVHVAFVVLAHAHVDLAVRVDALAALAVELREVHDVAHRLRRGVELVEVRGLGVRAEADVDLAALRAVERAPHRLLAMVADEPVALHRRLPLLRELDLLGARACARRRCQQ